MRRRIKNIWGIVGAISSGLVIVANWTGRLSFKDDWNTYVVPLWRDRIWPLMTTDNLAWAAMVASLATLVWANFGDWLRAKGFAFLGMGTAPANKEREVAPTLDHGAGGTLNAGAEAQIAKLDRRLAELSARLGMMATREDLHKVRVELNELKESFAQGAEAYRVLEARAKIKFLEPMRTSMTKHLANLALDGQEAPSDEERARNWLWSKTSSAEAAISQAAHRLHAVGFDGIELMRTHLAGARSYTNEKPKFRQEPEFLNVPPEIKKHYHACIMRLELMQSEYQRALDQLQSKADIELHT
jgi:hypothetical protein